MYILVVDDEAEMRSRLRAALESRGYQVETAADGDEALDCAATAGHDLILLDIMLPGTDGFSVLEHLRRTGIDTPVLILTALGAVDERIRGLDAGADDYLAKPFSMDELLARIRSILRRNSGRDSVLVVGDVVLDPAARTVRRGDGAIELTALEFSILEFLLYNKGRSVSRFNLSEHVWGDDFDPFSMSNYIDVHIKNLRRKLGSTVIRTVRGVGYIVDYENRRQE